MFIYQADPSDTAGFLDAEECFSESEREMFSSGNLSQVEECYIHFDLYDDNLDRIRDSDSESPYFDLEEDMLKKMKKKFRKKYFAF